ncbi:MAG TPA: hypothetical protein DF480_00860 [Clostridiales bacterium]|nr:hypothetical protein [Clostridiales bacterium]
MRLIENCIDPQVLKALSAKYQVPGITCRLIRCGTAEETIAFGVKNTETGESMTPDTMFEAASLTKTLFATLVLRLVDRGIFSLDKPVAELAQGIRVTDDDRIRQVTIRQILSHGAGLPNWADKPLAFLFEPGKGFSYSGEGYYYLQKIVEKVTGKSFVDHMMDEFFTPLGMENSAAIWDPSVGKRMSCKFNEKGAMLPLRDHVDLAGNAPEPNAAWSLYSGARDFSEFLLELFHHQGHLSESLFREMRSPQNKADDGVSWGLGLGIPSKDPSAVWHWGDNGGYRSFAVIDLSTGDGGCVFCNGPGGTDLGLELFSRMTDGVFWAEIGRFLETAE